MSQNRYGQFKIKNIMIRSTLSNTKKSTFAIVGPSSDENINIPYGTGFFISGEGHFVTAAHVLYDPDNQYNPRFDLSKILLVRDIHDEQRVGNTTCCTGAVIHLDTSNDFALLKVSDHELQDASWLINGKFPHLKVSERVLHEAEPVYSYGYPLSETVKIFTGQTVTFHLEGQGHKTYPLHTFQTHLCPRITSLIVSSRTENSNAQNQNGIPNTYVLDKALNYGNSGGPIVSILTGFVHGMCRRFQPVGIRQNSIKDSNNNPIQIIIPSLYGIATNLSIPSILEQLKINRVVVKKDKLTYPRKQWLKLKHFWQ